MPTKREKDRKRASERTNERASEKERERERERERKGDIAWEKEREREEISHGRKRERCTGDGIVQRNERDGKREWREGGHTEASLGSPLAASAAAR